MPKSFDASMLQSKLNEYINELNDLITTDEEVMKYTGFCSALFALKAMTDTYYNLDKDGNFQVMAQRQKLELMNAYRDAIKAGTSFLGNEDEGPVAAQMNSIIKEMMPLLQSDYMALDMADVKQSMPLPEIISRGRTQVVDLGEQAVKIESGLSSNRQHIRVENGTDVEEGYFTPTVTVDVQKKYNEFFDELGKKYGPSYKSVIDEFKKTNINKIFDNEFGVNPYGGLERMNAQERQEILSQKFNDNLYYLVDFANEEIKDLDEYFKFSDEVYRGLSNISRDYEHYYGKKSFLNIKQGSNIDRRNVAMYRMAGMFGKSDLIPETRPMTVIENGVPVTGTFMAVAHGVDMSKITAESPILKYKPEAFDNPAVFDDIAAMQALDFICGNVDRHPGNFFMRFEPKDAENAKLVGITLIDNDMSFGDASESKRGLSGFSYMRNMGVIGEDFYNAMRIMTREQMELMLSDCSLSQDEIDRAWERKETLQKKIEEDMEFFKDKAPGFTEKGRIRVVPKEEWTSYSIAELAKIHPSSKFDIVANGAELAKESLDTINRDKENEQITNRIRQEMGIIDAPAPKVDVNVPVGNVIGNGMVQKQAGEMDAPAEEIVKLAIPSLATIPTVGDNLSCRYLLSYKENGQDKEVFFTPKQDSGIRAVYISIFNEAIRDNPKYENELIKLRDYYSSNDLGEIFLPGKVDKLPLKEIGIPEARIEELKNDKKFKEIYNDVSGSVTDIGSRNAMLSGYGLVLEEGKRLELRNVAMSDVADIIGADNSLARSKPVQVMCNGKLIDGVIMDKAEGVDIQHVPGNHPMAQIPVEKHNEVYNTPEGLKSIADLQILDYVCLNVDRHGFNLMYRFEGLGTDHPRFVGVTGIDNDASFGEEVPDPSRVTNKLGALNDFQVISENMASKIMDEKTSVEIVESLKKRGLSESEVDAAKQRIENIKTAINDGRLRVVKDGEWAKGDNTLEKLSAKSQSLFAIANRDAFKEMSKCGLDYKNKHNGVIEPYKQKSLKFAKCLKADSFGKAALDNKEFAELEQEATRHFLDNIKMKAVASPKENAMSEKDMVTKIHQDASGMLKLFEDADPTFSFTSKTYKEVKSACKDLEKLSKKLSKKMKNKDDILSAKDSRKLIDAMNKLNDKTAAYKAKKDKEVKEGRALSKVAPNRIEACNNNALKTSSLLQSYAATIISQEASKSPVHTVFSLISNSQAKLSGLTGEKLRIRVAEIIYYKGLSRIDKESKRMKALNNAVQPDVMKKERAEIMKLPAFKKLDGMPDNELRNLAAAKGGEKLMNEFIRETAKIMQQNRKAQQNVRRNNPQKNRDNNMVK